MQKVYVTKRFTFEAAHNLVNYVGKCHNLHGHSYKLEVTVSRKANYTRLELEDAKAKDYMVVDFSDLKEIVKQAIEKYDHCFLNDYFFEPTVEVMVVTIFNDILENIRTVVRDTPKLNGLHLEEVKLWETEDSYATYRGEKT